MNSAAFLRNYSAWHPGSFHFEWSSDWRRLGARACRRQWQYRS